MLRYQYVYDFHLTYIVRVLYMLDYNIVSVLCIRKMKVREMKLVVQ